MSDPSDSIDKDAFDRTWGEEWVMKSVIFDLNRTLYEPEKDDLLPDVRVTLEALFRSKLDLHVLSRQEPGREGILERFGISEFFVTQRYVPKKTLAVFDSIFAENALLPKETFVVGDYLHEEIRFGNQCGAFTIWLCRGKFMHLQPECADDHASRVVTELAEVVDIILGPRHPV